MPKLFDINTLCTACGETLFFYLLHSTVLTVLNVMMTNDALINCELILVSSALPGRSIKS